MNRIAWTFLGILLTAWLFWTLAGIGSRVSEIQSTLREDQSRLEAIARMWISFHEEAPPTRIQELAENPTLNRLSEITGINPQAVEATRIVLVLYPGGLPSDRRVPIGWTAGLDRDGYWKTTPYPQGGFLLLSDGTVAYRDGGRDVEYFLRTEKGNETSDPGAATGPTAIRIRPDWKPTSQPVPGPEKLEIESKIPDSSTS